MDASASGEGNTAVVLRPGVDASASDGAAATDRSSDAAPGVLACDPDGDPRVQEQAGCAIDLSLAVLVAQPTAASFGDGSAPDGSTVHPFATISDALAHLDGKTRIYVCDGTYRDQITMTAAAHASLYGGFACTNGWTWDGGATQVLGPMAAPALSVTGLTNTGTVSIEDLAFALPGVLGQDSAGNGHSSIAAIVDTSDVVFAHVTLAAGSAGDGGHGADQPPGGASNDSGPPPPGESDGIAPVQKCAYVDSAFPPNDSSTGGAGATASSPIGGQGASNPPVPASFMQMTGRNGLAGSPGADGVPRPPAAPAPGFGTVSLVPPGWIPSAGPSGPAGQPGQGGGGGSAFRLEPAMTTVPGGAGGAGGCGGAGGGGGGGGGASIALLSVNANVQLISSTLQVGLGGRGGDGGPGQSGQGGAAGWTRGGSADPASGGAGGAGAGGAGGTGGATGISAGIVYVGAAPSIDTGAADATQFVLPTGAGGAGAGGPGGAGGGESSGQTAQGPQGLPGYVGGTRRGPFDVLAPPWT
jgi:hypothetical protein